MSSAEYMEWFARYQKEPWGDYRVDFAGAQVSAMLASIHRDTKKHQKPFSVIDFMPFVSKPKPRPIDRLRDKFGHLVKRKK